MRPTRLLGLWLLVLPAFVRAQTTTSFGYTGSPQAYYVPAGVTSLNVVATGGSAGGLNGSATSYGAQVSATLTVVPGELLTVRVGGQGDRSNSQGGYNGGGQGGDGGGGATDLRRAAPSPRTGDYLASRNALVVAGGGGGGSSNGAGGTGGTPSGAPGSPGTSVGQGATQAGPGSGGGAGSAGTTNLGGAGSTYTSGSFTFSGGGGGGGYYGGGGGDGAAGSGGGGGSSFVTTNGSSSIVYGVAPGRGNGALTLQPVYAAPTLTSLSPASGAVGTSITLAGTNLSTATAVSFNGTAATFTVGSATTLTATVPSGATGGPVTVTTPGGTTGGVAFTVETDAPVLNTPYGNQPNNGTPPFSGTAPAGSTVLLYLTPNNGAPQLLATVMATSRGAFSYTPPAALASGRYSAYATAQSSGQSVSAASPTIIFTLDSTPPTVVSFTRLTPTDALTNASSVTFRLVFSEDVMHMQGGTATATGSLGYAGPFATPLGGGTFGASVYDVTVNSLTGNGTLTLSVSSGITDAAGNALAGTGPFSQFYTIDRTIPTAVITTTAGSSTSTSPIPFSVMFSETVTNFSALSLTLYNGSVTGSRVAGSGSGPYTFSVTPSSPGLVTVRVTGNTVQDLAGNRNDTSGPLSVQYVSPPTLTAISPGSGPAGTSVTLTGQNLDGATAVSFNGTPATFTVNASGTLTATVPSGASSGPVTVTTPGGPSNGVAFTVVEAPSVTPATITGVSKNSAILQATATNPSKEALQYGFLLVAGTGTPTFTDTNLRAGTIIAGASTTANIIFVAISLTPGTLYSVRPYVIYSAGTVYGNVVTFTTLPPTPSLISLSPGSGPAGTSVTLTGQNLDGATAVSFNGTPATFTVNASGTLTATVPSGASSGPVTVTTPGGVSNGVAFTVVAPTTVTSINRVGSTPTNASSVSYTVTFAAAVTGLSVSNFALATIGNVAGASITSVTGTGTGTTYTVAVSTGTGDGTLGLNLANATGLSPGVSNVPFTGQVYTLDKTAPVASFTSTPANPTNNSFVNFRLTGNDPAGNGLATIEFYFDNALRASSPGITSLNFQTTDGQHTTQVRAIDQAGNVGPFASYTFTVDTQRPTVTSLTSSVGSSSTSPIPFAVSFSEPVTGFAASGISVTNGTVSSGPGGSSSGPYTFQVTPAGNGPVTVSINANAAQDAATNGNSASGPVSVQYTAPVAAGLRVQYQTGDLGQPTDGQVRPFLQLVNSGPTAVPYAGLTVRYWLTVENFSGQLVTPIDWAKLGTGLVSARYVALPAPRQGALGYIEYSFAAGAGSLAAGTDSGPVYGKAYKPSYSSFDETDDWSYQASGSFTANDHITLYQNGVLIAGTEPPAVAATTSLRVYAGNQDTSPTTSYLSVALQVGNVGNLPVSYADLKVRYWFTPDGPQPLVYQVDYTPLGNQNFGLQTGQAGTQPYAELSFASTLGTLYPSSNTGTVQFKIRKSDYSAFTQTDDYSFSSSAAIVEQPRITAYLNGQLVFGTEPDGAAAATARSSQPTGTAASATATSAGSGPLELRLTGSPNPFGDQLRLQFALPTPQAYTLAVYDGQGRLVQQLASGEVAAGQAQQVEVPTQAYAAGLYLVRLTTATGVQALKLVKR